MNYNSLEKNPNRLNSVIAISTYVLLTICFFFNLTGPALAEKITKDQLSNYLNDLKILKADFTQINPDGKLQTGSVFVKKPGKIRFEYDPPNKGLVLAFGGQLAIFDPKGNLAPERYPLKRTPLSFLLAKNIDLEDNSLSVAHSYDGISTTLKIDDPKFPESGFIELIFTGPLLELRQWVIQNQYGERTTFVLNDLIVNVNINDSLFSIPLQMEKLKSQR